MAWKAIAGNKVAQMGSLAAAKSSADCFQARIDRLETSSQSILKDLEQISSQLKRPVKSIDFSEIAKQLDAISASAAQSWSALALGDLKTHVKEIDSLLQQWAQQNGELRAQVQALKSQVAQLQAQLTTLQAKMQQQQHERGKVLLGQTAYTLDKAACRFVFAEDNTYLTLKSLAEYYDCGLLTGDQALRWEAFVRFLVSNKWSVTRLSTVTKPLRHLRHDAAHGTAEEHDGVTPQQLQDWSKAYLPSLAGSTSDFLQLLSLLTEPGRPLVLRSDLSELVSRASSTSGAG